MAMNLDTGFVMRSMLAATVVMFVAGPVAAQTSAPAVPPATAPAAKQKQAAPVARPPAPVDAAAVAERTALQSDLVWAGDYNGVISGEANERMTASIRAFQKNNGGKITGTLSAPERALLADAAKKQQDNVGWKIVSDIATGVRLGVPLKLVPQISTNAEGTRWASTTGTIQIQVSRRKDAAATIATVAEREKKEPAGRRIDYAAVRPDFFVVSGMQGLKKFYVRGQIKDGEVRLMTVLYDQATEGTMEPVVIAMSSAFTPFPAGVQAGVPPPRKNVEYATGVVVSVDGVVLTDRLMVDGCQSIVVPGYGHAERFAEDRLHDLALLRLYGARGLVPIAIGAKPAAASVDIVGIADPQDQSGGAAVSVAKAQIAPAASGDPRLSPAPGPGLSGAAARDGSGHFAGIALLKPAVVAGPASSAAQAVLVPSDVVSEFLKHNSVAVSALSGGDATASVVRVICVTK
ncbi:MAG: Peptidoglycan-binding domain 1 [Tardiphaga sp.]|nr:Peptidoglycan-binding domain 1 [Tardiphaga sp.]